MTHENETQMRSVASLLLKDVPGYRVRDSSFWTLAYRQLVHARPDNGPRDLYERLLPYLNTRPLMSNIPAGLAKDVSQIIFSYKHFVNGLARYLIEQEIMFSLRV